VLLSLPDMRAWATMTDATPRFMRKRWWSLSGSRGRSRRYFEIEVNPLTRLLRPGPAPSRSGYTKDFAWNCDGLRTRGARHGHSLDGGAGDSLSESYRRASDVGAQWRANFHRIDRPEGTPRELSAWSPTGLGTFMCRSGLG